MLVTSTIKIKSSLCKNTFFDDDSKIIHDQFQD